MTSRQAGGMLSAEACRAALEIMVVPKVDRIARAELLESGVPHHRIDALYPVPFEYFATQVSALLEKHGTSHLSIEHVTGGRWEQFRIMERLMENQLPKDVRLAKEQEGLAQWKPGLAGREMVDLVHAETLRWFIPIMADTCAGSFGVAAFGAYWFTLHSERALKVGGMDALARTFVNQLLPPGSV